ncbi:hypothetical protein LOK49_LG14G01337 [Camellia lanceoleosa]|uniref:Uncharacterized protein n=1 Tax=Camellia lanceoleosa TaxID=1840588 RepID=A0ACC0FDN9_9ERIC|nr:hypothetical protein LOK49_LG14G01337 [Camellia lanceoleosa]
MCFFSCVYVSLKTVCVCVCVCSSICVSQALCVSMAVCGVVCDGNGGGAAR